MLVHLARSSWEKVNFAAPRVINMAKAFNPCMLRVGGLGEDFLIFDREITPGPTKSLGRYNKALTSF